MSDYETVYACAVRLLVRREHSSAELLQKLLQRAWPESICYEVLNACQDQGLQSDRRFAEHFVEVKHRAGWGPLYIEYQLKLKKITPSLIDQSVSSISHDDWVMSGQRWLSKRLMTSYYVDKQGFQALLRRGFNQDLIQSILKDRRD